MLRYIAVTLGMALTLVPAATAQDFQRGLAAAERGDYAASLREWRPLAEKGDIDAQYNLGVMYFNGQGVPKDGAEARRWLAGPVQRGHPGAQFLWGLMYAEGRGVPRDRAEAVKWYRRAAHQGYSDAQVNLGFMYARGLGVERDCGRALGWYRKAAARGDSQARRYIESLKEGADGGAEGASSSDASRAASACRSRGTASLGAGAEGLSAPPPVPPPVLREELAEAAAAPRGGPIPRAPADDPARRPDALGALDAALARIREEQDAPGPLPGPREEPRVAQEGSPGGAPAGHATEAGGARAAFRVQLGALKTSDEGVADAAARRLKRALAAELGGLEVAAVRADLGERGIYYRLQAGPLADRAAAGALCDRLADMDRDCFVVAP